VNPAGAVVVSGASSGIGAATVRLLAGEGFIAYAGVRSEADALRAGALHPNVRPVQIDVTDEASIARAAAAVAADGLPLLGVVSNAGIAVGGPLEHLTSGELRRQFDVNVFGALALVQAFSGRLIAGGRIVFVGSIAGRLATPYVGAYSASKFALRAIADAMRVELAPAGITVSLVEPGSVKTPIWKKGRDAGQAMVRRLGDGKRLHYRRAFERVIEVAATEERTGISPDVVSLAIVHALRSPRPRAQYVVGGPARIGNLIAILPAGLRDRAARAAMRIP
jgi:NAD(P)-dependent dehydrogenase (short-subunit alcohol dehydrogenase family)